MIGKSLIVIPECDADTALAQFVAGKAGLQARSIQHARGTKVKAAFDKNEWSVAIVDNDKKKFLEIDSYRVQTHEHSLTLLQRDNLRHVIMLQPTAIEQWLIDCARTVQVDLSSMNIPDDPRAMKRELTGKLVVGWHKKNFLELLNTLYRRNVPGMTTLEQWLKELAKV